MAELLLRPVVSISIMYGDLKGKEGDIPGRLTLDNAGPANNGVLYGLSVGNIIHP